MSRRASRGWRTARREGEPLARRLLFVAFFIEVGLLLMVLPWSGFWERNYFAAIWPALRDVVANDFVRGGVTGLGLVNLVAGFIELAPIFAKRDARIEQ
jgi:hypothetical protein